MIYPQSILTDALKGVSRRKQTRTLIQLSLYGKIGVIFHSLCRDTLLSLGMMVVGGGAWSCLKEKRQT